MKFNIWSLLTVGLIALCVGDCLDAVGHMKLDPNEPYGWELPIGAFVMFSLPAYLGYMWGKGEK